MIRMINIHLLPSFILKKKKNLGEAANQNVNKDKMRQGKRNQVSEVKWISPHPSKKSTKFSTQQYEEEHMVNYRTPQVKINWLTQEYNYF